MPIPAAQLAAYADLIVHVGLNLQPGQRLIIGNRVPFEAAPLVRAVAAGAYRAGARLVDVLWHDDQLVLTRLREAPADSFGEFSGWRMQALLDHVARDDAGLFIAAEDPDLLRGQDPERIGSLLKTAAQAGKPVSEAIGRNLFNWSVVALPVAAWAAKAFGGEQAEPEVLIDRLWELVARACRLHLPDPVAAWRTHLADLAARAQYLTARGYTGLRFTGPGTDLTLGLPLGHLWLGGQSTSRAGITFTPNLPTEEVFTLPDRARTEGVVRASLPLSHLGNLIENFTLTFAAGRVVRATAERGETALRQLLDIDDGASRLGEVALVAASSPVAAAGRLFYNTLFDENAASHLALGAAYRFCLPDGEALDDGAFAAAGGNLSALHLDFMIGSAAMDVDGLTAGGAEPLMRQGEWAFSVPA
jgi:aminopeptidase